MKRGAHTAGYRFFAAGLLSVAIAAAAYGTLQATLGPRPVSIHVRWAPDVDDFRRQVAERRYRLSEGTLLQGRTWVYTLSDPSRMNVSALVRDASIDDTQDIDRAAFRVSPSAPRRPYPPRPHPWIPVGLRGATVLFLFFGLSGVGLGCAERAGYRVPRTRQLLPDLMLAGSALLGIELIAAGDLAFGSALGHFVYPVESDVSLRSLLVMAFVVPAALAGFHYGNRWIELRQERVLALWFVFGTGAVFAIRWLYPVSLGAVVESDANSFYSPTLTYSALQFVSQFEQIVSSLPLHAATNLPGKVLLFHLLQTVTDSPQIMGALIVVISNVAAVILFYVVKRLSQSGSVALMSFVLCLFLPARLVFLPILNTVTPVLILASFWLLLEALESRSRAVYGVLGVSLYVAFLFEPLPLVMGLLFGAMVVRAMLTGALPWIQAAELCVLTAAGFAATHVVFVELFDFNLLDAFFVALANAVNFNGEDNRPYSIWIVANLKETFLAVGIAPAVFLSLVVAHLTRTLYRAATSPQSSLATCLLDKPVVFTLTLVGTLAFLDLLGINRGEVTRLWIFLFCFMTAATAWFIDRWKQPLRFQLILALTLLQAVVESETVGFVVP